MCTEEPLGGLTHGAILSDEIQTPIGQLHKSVGGMPAGCVFRGDAHGDWIDVTASWSVSDDFSTPMDNSRIFRRTGTEIRQRGKEGQ